MSKYSIIIKNGEIFDGNGNESQKTDIGISGGEIKKIGNLQEEPALNIIDAAGKYVAPGFIDLTNHSDTHWTLFTHPLQESLITQGVTTILGGSCGSSLAPFLGESSTKEIKRWVDTSKININWRTMEGFLSEMEKHKLGINFGTFVGFNTVCQTVLDSKEELKKIKFLLKLSLDEGAFGVSTSFGAPGHKFFNDEDIADIFKKIGGKKILTKHHLEDEGEDILPSISRLIGIARASSTKMHFSHFKALGRNSWKIFSDAINMANKVRAEGMQLTYDFFPYTKTGSSLIMLLPSWFRKLPTDEAKTILTSKTDERRQALKDYLSEITLHYDNIIVASAIKEFGAAGKTIADIGENLGSSGEETILNLLSANDLRVSIFNEAISEENVDILATDRFSAISSDGVGYSANAQDKSDLPHPRSFGTFPRALDVFIKKKAILDWKDLIYKITGLPAKILGLKDRGFIVKGSKADIVVFDPVKISDNAIYDNPFQYSSGVEHVIVNGKAVLSGGKFTGERPGDILRKK